MTEQERAAALADKIELRGCVDLTSKWDWGQTNADSIELIVSALRAYARPAPVGLREAIITAAVQTGEFGRPGAERFADAVLSLLPQTQERDVLGGAIDALLHAKNALACYRFMLTKHSPDNAWVGGFERDMQAIKDAIERLDRAKEG